MSLIVLGLFVNVVNAEDRVEILTDETFEISVNEENLAVYTMEFNFTVPAHEGNITFVLEYSNEIENVVYERCYVIQASIYVGGVQILFKTYDDAQGFKITVDDNLVSDFEHKGEIVLFGSSPTLFYGTINLSVDYVPSGGGLDWIFRPFGSDALFYVLFFSSFGVPIIIFAIRRRRRGKEE